MHSQRRTIVKALAAALALPSARLLADESFPSRPLPGFDWQAWQGISVPAATPPAVVARLSREMQKFQDTEEFKASLAKIGMEPWPPNTPADFAKLVEDDMPRWAAAVRAAGAKVD